MSQRIATTPSDETFQALVERLAPGARLTGATRLLGGVSADVFKLEFEHQALQDSCVVRIHGETHGGHPAAVEYEVLAALHRAGVAVPEPLVVDASGGLMPEPWLAMAFVEGSTSVPGDEVHDRIDKMADALASIHAMKVAHLPKLELRLDPRPELFDWLPSGRAWQPLDALLRSLPDTTYGGTPCLLHGDFWPENLLWKDGRIEAILDWEDAALGDPVSDVASARVELRYQYGPEAMRWFLDAYERHFPVDRSRLALWQVYVAAAAHRYMGEWGLEREREAHMRKEALASIREAGTALMGQAAQ